MLVGWSVVVLRLALKKLVPWGLMFVVLMTSEPAVMNLMTCDVMELSLVTCEATDLSLVTCEAT